jgi:beta-lactamase class A
MPHPVTRRGVIAGLSACLATPASADASALASLERRHGGRLGVFAVDAGSGRSLACRADERFLLCSTFKMLAVAAVLERVDAGRERLERSVRYARTDLLEYAPVTRAHVAQGALSVTALCRAAVEVSDNTAANLLLASLGGPEDVTRFIRRLGDPVTRLDRNEPSLNRPAGMLDTTTPRAMAHCARAILLERALAPASRGQLELWMVASTPGLERLRAGVPRTWRVGDKSGTSDAATNDVAIMRPPRRPALIVAAYYEAPDLREATREAVLRQVGLIVARWAA